MDPAELMLEARSVETLDVDSLPNFPPPRLFATRVAARLALFLALDRERLGSEPEAVLRRVPEGELSGRTVVVNDPIVALEAAAAGCEVRVMGLRLMRSRACVDPRCIADPEALEEALDVLGDLSGYLRERLGDLYDDGARYYVWVNSVECPGCGLRVPTMDDPRVVSGRRVLELEVDGGEVSLRVVRPQDLSDRSTTVLDATVTCPRCGERVGLGRAQRECREALEAASRLPSFGVYLPREEAGRVGPASYLAAVVTKGGVREAREDDLEGVREAIDRVLELYGHARPVSSGVYLNERQTLSLLEIIGFLRGYLDDLEDGGRSAAGAIVTVASVISGLNSAHARWVPEVASPGWPTPANVLPWVYGETVPWALVEEVRGWLKGFLGVVEAYPTEGLDGTGGAGSVDASVFTLRFGRWYPWLEAMTAYLGRYLPDAPSEGGRPVVGRKVVYVVPDADALPDALRFLREAHNRGICYFRARAWVLRVSTVLEPTRGGGDGASRRLARELPRRRAGGASLVPYARVLGPSVPGDLYEAFRDIVEEVVKELGVSVSRPESRLYLTYRYVFGYPRVQEAPRREEFEALVRAVSLAPGDLPVRFAGGRAVLETWRDRDPEDLDGSDDPVDALHRCLHEMEPPEDGEVRELLEGICRLAWDHPEVGRAADLVLRGVLGDQGCEVRVPR